jgi:hypothetical protein
MKKFYFLNKNKHWQGPYIYPQILFFCLNGNIKPTSYLWNNKMAIDIGEHPSKSIYARKNARDFSTLPVWVFSYNLKIIAINKVKSWKKKLEKKDNWKQFIAKPIAIPASLENAIKIYLLPSISAIHDFASPPNFKIKLIYIDRNENVKESDYAIRLIPDNNSGIKFEIIMVEPPNVGGVEHKESYGLHRKLFLINENEIIEVAKNSVFDFSTKYPYQPQILEGRFSQANLQSPNNYKNCYNRLILKVNDDKIIGPQKILAHTGTHLYDDDKFNIHSSLMGVSFRTGGKYTEVVIGGIRYNFFDVEGGIIIIDAADKEDFIVFKQKVEVIRIALSILSGRFYGGTCNYVSSDDANFKKIDGIWYELEKKSILTNRRVIDLDFFRSTFKEEDQNYVEKYHPFNSSISAGLFSALCEALWTNESLIHTANLIISGMGNSDPLQQGALYSVALETLTTTLGEAKSKELKPIPEKELSQAFVGELKAVLLTYEDKISAEGSIILDKNIESVNRPTNRDKLIKTFQLYGISLSEEDKQTINKRNDYLHGRNPLDLQHTFELTQISLRLHTLIVALLLKTVGYTGHIINLDVHIYLTDEEKMLELSVQNQAIYTRLLYEIGQTIKNQDFEKLKTAKEEISNYLKDNRLNNLIRII